MGQIIKRPFKSFNGTDWDTHYFKTSIDMIEDFGLRSISFGKSSSQVFSGSSGTITYDKVFDDRDKDTSLATLSSGKIKILKTGNYFISCKHGYSCAKEPNGVREELRKNSKAMVVNITGGYWSTAINGHINGIFKLAANDLLENFIDVHAGEQTTCDTGTIFTLIYLSE